MDVEAIKGKAWVRDFELVSKSMKGEETIGLCFSHESGVILDIDSKPWGEITWTLRFTTRFFVGQFIVGPCGSFENDNHFQTIFNDFLFYAQSIKNADDEMGVQREVARKIKEANKK